MPIIGSLGFHSVTVSTTAVGITTTASNNILPAAAEIRVEDEAIRYCVDGTTATQAVGQIAEPGDVIYLKNRGEVTAFSAIRKDLADAELAVTTAADWKP